MSEERRIRHAWGMAARMACLMGENNCETTRVMFGKDGQTDRPKEREQWRKYQATIGP